MKRVMRIAGALAPFAMAALLSTNASAAGDTLRIGHYGLPPMFAQPYAVSGSQGFLPITAAFDALTYMGEDGKLAPGLAATWSNTAPDTWVIKLRPGVKFHNGKDFNADALIANMDAILNDDVVKAQQNARQVQNIASTRKVDDLTVEVKTKKNDPIFDRRLAILRPHEPGAWKDMGAQAFARKPVGTGSYRIEDWGLEKVSGTAFKEGWRPAQVPKLEIVTIAETPARVSALASGQLDIAWELGPDNQEQVARGGQFIISKMANALHFAFNNVRETAVRDVRVRQALNHAYDKDSFVKNVMRGLTPPVGQLAAGLINGSQADIKPYPYDPAKARALLAEAGYRDNLNLTIETIVAQGEYKDFAETLANDWRKVGVNPKIHVMVGPEALNKILGRDPWIGDGFVIQYQGFPTNDISTLMARHSCAYASPWFCLPAITPTVEAMETEMDPAKRADLQRKISQFYHDQAAAVFSHERMQFDGLAANVRNYKVIDQVVQWHAISFAN